MALYIPYSVFHLARLLYVRPETFGPYYIHMTYSFVTEGSKLIVILFLGIRGPAFISVMLQR